MTRLQEHYQTTLKPALMQEFGYKNAMQAPKLHKIIINMGVGEASQDRKLIAGAIEDMTRISGQKPVITKAKKSIAAFKLRAGMIVGCKVTLRGLSAKSFDGNGNFALGLKEQIVFPEVDYDKVDKVRGMDVVICTTAATDNEAVALLKGFDMPFAGRGEEQTAAEQDTENAAEEPKDEIAEEKAEEKAEEASGE